jgi:adenylate cyclase
MLDELERLNRNWEAQGLPPWRIGIGLHTGLVTVGNIGSRVKTEFTAIGDTVNLASRLQDTTKQHGCAIVVSQAVRDDLGEGARLRELGESEIRGRSRARIWCLEGLGAKPSDQG